MAEPPEMIDRSDRVPKNQDALFRHWHMLRLMPRHPRKISVQEIRQELERAGFEITERSIQRDLNELSTIFPLVSDTREKPYGWSWQQDAPSFDLPGLTAPEALTLSMAEQYLHDLLPAPVLNQLRPYFNAARKCLEGVPKRRHGRAWSDKVRVIPPTQPLLPPRVNPDVQRVVSEALLEERQIQVSYKRRGETKSVSYRIQPLAMVQRGPVLYLSVRIFDYDEIRMLALHRIQSAEFLEDHVDYPADFSIEKQAEDGFWGFGNGEKIRVELLFDEGYGEHLLETPLSSDQTVEATADGSLRIRATVADTPQLRWWILGFGEGVEVLDPRALREEVSATVENTHRRYTS